MYWITQHVEIALGGLGVTPLSGMAKKMAAQRHRGGKKYVYNKKIRAADISIHIHPRGKKTFLKIITTKRHPAWPGPAGSWRPSRSPGRPGRRGAGARGSWGWPPPCAAPPALRLPQRSWEQSKDNTSKRRPRKTISLVFVNCKYILRGDVMR